MPANPRREKRRFQIAVIDNKSRVPFGLGLKPVKPLPLSKAAVTLEREVGGAEAFPSGCTPEKGDNSGNLKPHRYIPVIAQFRAMEKNLVMICFPSFGPRGLTPIGLKSS